MVSRILSIAPAAPRACRTACGVAVGAVHIKTDGVILPLSPLSSPPPALVRGWMRSDMQVGNVADLEDDLSLLREPLEQIAERSQQLSEIYEFEKRHRTFGLRGVNDNADSVFEAKLAGLEERAAYSVHQAGAYKRFFMTLIFLFTYATVLFMQRKIDVSFEIETSLIMQLITELQSVSLSGGYVNEGRSAKGLIKGVDEFYEWFDKAIIQRVFQGAVCGDGSCDAPEEFPGFGRFGCERDCGRYTKTTSLKVDLRTFISSSPQNWDISEMKFASNPNFRYNIFSDTLQDFMWEEDQDGIQNPINTIDVPDGKLTLHLYQGTKVAAQSDASAPADLRMRAAEFPAANASASVFEYGDPAEVLMFARTVMRGLEDTCWESAQSILLAPKGCDKFDWWDWYTRALGSYGLAGSVRVDAGRVSAGSEVGERWVSVVDVPFCGVLPGAGVDDAKTRQELVSASEPCANPAAPGGPRTIKSDIVPQTISNREGICISHHNCSAGLFCSRWHHKTGGLSTHVRRTGGNVGVCQPCNLCRVDSEDAWNASGVGLGVCPQDRCPGSGGLQECVSAKKLLSSLRCVSSYDFEVWTHHPKGSKLSVMPETIEQKPALFVTPNNRLVGAVVLTQERVSRSTCVPKDVKAMGITASFGWHRINPSLSNYTRAAGSNVRCEPKDPKLDTRRKGGEATGGGKGGGGGESWSWSCGGMQHAAAAAA